jgi:Cytosol aminopeptidase family, N-terminal domain
MTRKLLKVCLLSLAAMMTLSALADESVNVKEQLIEGPHSIHIRARMEGPYTADTPLQTVCYFKYTKDGAKRMTGAPVELDKRLGGVIDSLRTRGEFQGAPLETILIRPKDGTIKAKSLLLIGLGDESQLSLNTMERVGQTALRQAKAVGATKVAFAPLLRDQGNSAFGVGAVGTAVVKGMLLAYETELRLQNEGLSSNYNLTDWDVEAGPAYFDETIAGVREAVSQAATETAKRSPEKHASESN